MTIQKKIEEVKVSLVKSGIDGWLLYDHCHSNQLACKFLEIDPKANLTRRFFYWIPQKGDPIKIVHKVESHLLDHLPGSPLPYGSWSELEHSLASVLKGLKRVAMEYSPRGAIPTVSKVDGGTLDLVREQGVEVVSSSDLLQRYTSILTEEQLTSHREAALILDSIVESVWLWIASQLDTERPITEYGVQQFILEEFAKNNCITSSPPICAVNAHSANPHYAPSLSSSASIMPDDFILIDLWCKKDLPYSIYADITRVGVAAKKPTSKQQEIFSIVKQARDSATEFVKKRWESTHPVYGYEVDQVSRKVITDSGYAPFFPHRTGHNIGKEDHGEGANIDDYETHEQRELLPGTCFSIEPGIYLPGEFGIRLEYDLYLNPNGLIEINGGVQNLIKTLIPL